MKTNKELSLSDFQTLKRKSATYKGSLFFQFCKELQIPGMKRLIFFINGKRVYRYELFMNGLCPTKLRKCEYSHIITDIQDYEIS